MALDIFRGAHSLWMTFGFCPTGLLTFVLIAVGKKELCIRDPGITLIAINEFPKIRFLRILHIVNDVRNGRRHIHAFSHMQRH